MNKLLNITLLFLCTYIMQSCKSNSADAGSEDVAAEDVVTPVTVTHPRHGNINETVKLNATSAFLLKTFVKSNATGYLQTAGIKVGDYVSKGQTLFTIKTKEAVALGNSINQLD